MLDLQVGGTPSPSFETLSRDFFYFFVKGKMQVFNEGNKFKRKTKNLLIKTLS